MTQSFQHDIKSIGVEVRTGTDGTWITLQTKNGASMSFQPITQFAPRSDGDIIASIVRKWCEERQAESGMEPCNSKDTPEKP